MVARIILVAFMPKYRKVMFLSFTISQMKASLMSSLDCAPRVIWRRCVISRLHQKHVVMALGQL